MKNKIGLSAFLVAISVAVAGAVETDEQCYGRSPVPVYVRTVKDFEDMPSLVAFISKHKLSVPQERKGARYFRKWADPIVHYDLSDENIERMTFLFSVAQTVEQKGALNEALSMYWDLANQGYGPANERLFRVFNSSPQRFGDVDRDVQIACFFMDRKRTVADMKKEQASLIRELIKDDEYQRQKAAAARKEADELVAPTAAPQPLNDLEQAADDTPLLSVVPGASGGPTKKGLFWDGETGLRRRHVHSPA